MRERQRQQRVSVTWEKGRQASKKTSTAQLVRRPYFSLSTNILSIPQRQHWTSNALVPWHLLAPVSVACSASFVDRQTTVSRVVYHPTIESTESIFSCLIEAHRGTTIFWTRPGRRYTMINAGLVADSSAECSKIRTSPRSDRDCIARRTPNRIQMSIEGINIHSSTCRIMYRPRRYAIRLQRWSTPGMAMIVMVL